MIHEALRVPLPSERIKDIMQSVEMLKAIEIEFKTKKYLINQWVVLINRNIATEITNILSIALQNLRSGKKYKEPVNTWVQYLMSTITVTLGGGYNLLRRTVINHCKCLIYENIMETEQKKQFEKATWQIDVIANWEWNVHKSTRCRFLYWKRDLYPVLLQRIFADRQHLNQLNYLTMAMRDPLELLVNVRHLESPMVAIDNYKKEIYKEFTQNFTMKVCKGIEEELRLQIH
jgi:WASH complex subunit 7/WASH complex subunit 7, N-terminal